MKTLKKRKRNRSRFLVKPIVAILLLAFVVGMMPGFVQAEREAKLVTMPTSDKSKREVVFARLRATGDVDNVYVVNHFNPARMSSLTDYGDYQEVIQLTGSVPPVLSGTTVSIAEAEGPYYYCLLYTSNIKLCRGRCRLYASLSFQSGSKRCGSL